MPELVPGTRRAGITLTIAGIVALGAGIAARWGLEPSSGRALLALPFLLAGGLALWAGLKALFHRNVLGPFLGLLLVYLLFVVVAPDTFYSLRNTKTVVTHSVVVGIAALGMTLVIISGGIDLSVGSIVALATVVTALLLNLAAPVPGVWATLGAAIVAILVGGAAGLANGAASAGLRIVPFIVTLGTMQILRGLAKWMARSQSVYPPDQHWLKHLMRIDPEPSWLLLAPGVWSLLGLTVIVALVLHRTVFGRYVYAIGSNENAARLCGIAVTRQRVFIYALCGLFTGLAGVLQFATINCGDPTAAIGMELDIIAAVVIGGGSLSGGEGGAVGSLVGALLMAILRNGCNQVGIPNFVQDIVIGAVIIGAVAVDRWKHRSGD